MSENARDSSTTEEKIYNQHYKKNISGELDVFEATQYFSDFNEPTTIESSRTQIQKQNTVQKRVHPETSEQISKPRVVVIKPQKKEKLNSFLKSLLRSVGLKKSKSKSMPEVETKKLRRKSCVVEGSSSPMTCVGSWSLNMRRRSFDERQVKGLKKSDENLSIRFCKDQNGGCESDSSSQSDLFDLDLFAKSNH